MPITAEQRELRRSCVGASDVPAICGCDPWRNAADVWVEKVYGTDDFTSDAADAGNRFEEPVLDWFEEVIEQELIRNERIVHPKIKLAANLDALLPADNAPVNAKTACLFGPTFTEEWGDSLTDDVPDRVIIQCHAEAACFVDRPDVAHVPAFIGGKGFVRYIIPINADLIATIEDNVDAFWKQVERGIKPEGEVPSLGTLKRMRRTPNKMVSLGAAGDDLIATWEAAKAIRKNAEQAVEQAQAAILDAMDDADGAQLPDGRLLTYMTESRKAYTVAANEFRVLRGPKKAK